MLWQRLQGSAIKNFPHYDVEFVKINLVTYYLPETLVTCVLLKLLPRIKFLASRDDCESNHFVVVKLIQVTK